MMIRADSIEEINLEKACITIGSFDGVHVGHQILINQLVASSRTLNAPAVVITFFPHPLVVLKNIASPYYLSTPDEKAAKLAALNVNILITIPFTKELAAVSAEEFMRGLKRNLGLKLLMVGKGFTLGKNRQGTVEFLSQLGEKNGFIVEAITPESIADNVISSSKIRQYIEEGDVVNAATLLGDYYCVHGLVEPGDARGRIIGFPTANLKIWEQKLLPKPGVYRCITIVDNTPYLSVTNIGYRPTFSNDQKSVNFEVHIIDFDGNVYGKELQVKFTHRLRGEIKFPSLDALVQQIHLDIHTAREL